MKKRKITDREQKIVSEILTDFMFCRNMIEVEKIWDEIFKEYELYYDPFTKCPVSSSVYFKNLLEYERQIMIEKYGHCDGLE